MNEITPTEVPAEITHLDFDPEQAPKCAGYKTRLSGETFGGNDFSCPKPAKVIVVRSCCGQIQYFCLQCHNAICDFHAEMQMKHGSTHSTPPHAGKGRPFSQVEF